MKEVDTMTVTKVGQSTLPQWWRESSGLIDGGLVEVRPMADGRNSILLTPVMERKGASGKDILTQFSRCPYEIAGPERHNLPFK